MRWLVDVTPLGNGAETETVQVDSESWQNALLAVRTRRGESAALSGFSIDLLDGGKCRVIDPTLRVRYDVRNVPERDETGAASNLAAAASESETSVGEPAASSVPRPSRSPARASTLPPRPSAPGRTVTRPPAAAGPTGGSAGPAQPTPIVFAHAAAGLPVDSSDVQAAPAPATARMHEAPAAPAPSVAERGEAFRELPIDLVPAQIIFKREQDRTAAQPLTYREYVYAVPQGTSEAGALRLLQRQLDLVRTSLSQIPDGKLIHLAAFDVHFHGKPPVPPIATLTWKDWVGNAVVALPRRDAPNGVDTEADLPMAAAPADRAPVPVDPATARLTPLPADLAPLPADLAPLPADPAPLPADPALVRDPAIELRRRARGEDLIADLFEAMHELHFVRDAIEGGAFCLALCIEKIPCHAGVVHLYDIDRREFLVTNARGAGARQLLLRRTPELDPVLAAATRKRHAITVTYADESEAGAIDRYAAIGGARRLLVAPVMQAGRYLGAIELIDPLDGQPFTETEVNAMTYIAGQFADFVAARGVVTDPDRIAAPQR